MKLLFSNLPSSPAIPKFNQELLESTFIKILTKYKPDLISKTKNNSIQVNFISDKQIALLNKTYRNKEKPTDVLSWSFIDEQLTDHQLAGEIYISIETATSQSKKFKVTLDLQIYFLIIHGLLHIYHYDHNSDEQEHQMDLITQEVLSSLNPKYANFLAIIKNLN